MSLHRKLLITRWLEREKPGAQRQWKKHAAAAVSKRRKSQPVVSVFERREALLRKLNQLVEAAVGGATGADSGEDPTPEK